MDAQALWLTLPPVFALAIPFVLVVSAILLRASAPLQQVVLTTTVSCGLAGVLTALGIVAALTGHPLPRVALGVRLDGLTYAMLLLVSGLALVIGRYSRSYLHRDAGAYRYARWLLATFASVTTLVLANNLLVIALAWLCTGVSLYQLLTYYESRTPALIAAHKKFLVSRLGDVCVFVALGLIRSTVGSLELDVIEHWLSTQSTLPMSLEVAAGLLVVAVALKSAQVPFHGWLMQVMEAPTPVSALLHAGVVNIGGFLMIRLAPFMAHAATAQFMLVVIGICTVVVAALVMTTRVSVKVALAWSTCAQMGFMAVQCGLGLWHLAFLHLLAHSLYKAHAFLTAGSAVENWRVGAMGPEPKVASWSNVATGWGVSFLTVTFSAGALGTATGGLGRDASLAMLSLVLTFALTPLFVRASSHGLWRAAARGALVSSLYFGWHELFRHAFPAPEMAALPLVSWIIVLTGLGMLFAVQLLLQANPAGTLATRLHPMLFAGLYLDDLFTRWTFRIWPPQLPAQSRHQKPRSVAAVLEA